VDSSPRGAGPACDAAEPRRASTLPCGRFAPRGWPLLWAWAVRVRTSRPAPWRPALWLPRDVPLRWSSSGLDSGFAAPRCPPANRPPPNGFKRGSQRPLQSNSATIAALAIAGQYSTLRRSLRRILDLTIGWMGGGGAAGRLPFLASAASGCGANLTSSTRYDRTQADEPDPLRCSHEPAKSAQSADSGAVDDLVAGSGRRPLASPIRAPAGP
jgi:hypothetical protein